ncbi:MAG: hypothetical protein QM650_03095 [Microlunatus sp.]
MPIAPYPRRIGRPMRLASVLVTALFVPASFALASCAREESPISPASPGASATDPTPADSASPDLSASPDSAGSATPDPSASPGDSATPGASGTSSPGLSEDATVAPVSCSSVTPIRVEKSTVEPRRTTEVVTVVSDGRGLTPGTREQTDFTSPGLVAPDGTTTVDDEATLAKIAELIEKSSKHNVLLTRPDAPDAGIDADKRPFNTTGTFVLYRASGLLAADVVVDCSNQEQRWRFTSEANPILGTVNCAVEPPRSNAMARQVYGAFC